MATYAELEKKIKKNKKIRGLIQVVLLIFVLIYIITTLRPSDIDISNYKEIILGQFLIFNIFIVGGIVFTIKYLNTKKFKRRSLIRKSVEIILSIILIPIALAFLTGLYHNLFKYGLELQETKTICSYKSVKGRRGRMSYYLNVKTNTGSIKQLNLTYGAYEWFLRNYPNLTVCTLIGRTIRYEQIFDNVVW